MKNLFLHIGFGKTGSSALQVWLHNNADQLRTHGILYPRESSAKIDDYAITSGNGVRLFRALKEGSVDQLIKDAPILDGVDVLYSSEVLQELNEDEFLKLHSVAKSHDYNIVIIAFVRDLYDILYSAYMQLVKRHLMHKTFHEYGLSTQTLQQFHVLRKFEQRFDDIRLIHYDGALESGIEKAFCAKIGVDPNSMEVMAKRKVNRSLTSVELEILRQANEFFTSKFAPNNRFSSTISDALIYANPEAETEILLDQEVINHLETTFRSTIDTINDTYFSEPALKVFNPRNKKVTRKLPKISKEYLITLNALIHSVKEFEFAEQGQRKNATAGADGESNKLTRNDQRIVNFLRDEAIGLENKNPRKAFVLMAAAQMLRPNGPVINQKVEEYSERFSIVKKREG